MAVATSRIPISQACRRSCRRPAGPGGLLGEDSDEVTDLTLPDDQDEDEEMTDEEPGSPDMPTKGWIGLKSVRLNDGSHRVIRLAMSS